MTNVVELMLERGMRAGRQGRPSAAVRAYGEVLAHPSATPRHLSIAAFNRGLYRQDLEDVAGAFDDFSFAAFLLPAPIWLRCRAWLARANLRRREHDNLGAICDYTAVLQLAPLLQTSQQSAAESDVLVHQQWSPLELTVQSQTRRASARFDVGDQEGAINDIQAALSMNGISHRTRAEIHGHLAEALLLMGHWDESLAVASHCLQPEHHIEAIRCLIAIAHLAKGDWQAALSEIQSGLQWIKSLLTIDDLLEILAKTEKRTGPLNGAGASRALILKRKEELLKSGPKAPAKILRRLNW